MKTIIISSFHSLISRNILQTDILPLLSREYRIVILVFPQKEEYFKKYFESENVIIETVQMKRRLGTDVLKLISTSLVGVKNLYIRGLRSQGKYVLYFFARTIYILFGRWYWPRLMLSKWYKKRKSLGMFSEVFKKYSPSLVFVTDIYLYNDRELIKESRLSNIPVVGMVRSWDNVTTKGVLLEEPKHIIVQNDILKKELIYYNRINPENISVIGVPHYDSVNKDRSLPRDEFFDSLNLDAQKKTVLFSPAGKILYKDDGLVLSFLKHTNDRFYFEETMQFLVRFPPFDVADTDSVYNDTNFVIDIPARDVTGRRKENELSPDVADHLNNSLAYSDIVMTYASTMIIDAAVFDKPTIVIAFDLPGAKDTVKKFATYLHLQKLFKTKLCTIVYSEKELVEAVNMYSKHPEKDYEKRKQIAELYGYKTDGESGKRVAEVVSSFL